MAGDSSVYWGDLPIVLQRKILSIHFEELNRFHLHGHRLRRPVIGALREHTPDAKEYFFFSNIDINLFRLNITRDWMNGVENAEGDEDLAEILNMYQSKFLKKVTLICTDLDRRRVKDWYWLDDLVLRLTDFVDVKDLRFKWQREKNPPFVNYNYYEWVTSTSLEEVYEGFLEFDSD